MKKIFLYIIAIVFLLLLNPFIAFSQVKVSGTGANSSQTYNITNSADDVTTAAVTGTLRINNRQFVDAANETGFASAVSVAAAGGYNLRVTNSQSVNSDVTVPDSVLVEFVGAGKLTVTSATVTFRGGYSASRKQIFFGNGNIKVQGVNSVYPEHFGAKNDSTFDSSTAFNKAMNCFPDWTRGVVELASGAKYLISSTVYFPLPSTFSHVTLRGNGAFVYSNSSDSTFMIKDVTPAANSFQRGQNVIDGLRLTQLTRGQGVAIALVNATQQNVRDCHIEGFSVAILLLNHSGGWSEHNEFVQIRCIYNDTMVVMNAMDDGSSSFRNNFFQHFAGSMSESKVIDEGGRAVGVALIGTGDSGTPSMYQNTFINFSPALSDSTEVFYINGRCENVFGQASTEVFGGDSPESYFFHFGPNASNLMFDFYIDIQGSLNIDKVIFNESSYAPQGIKTQWRGQTSASALGISHIWDGTHQQWIASVIHNDSLGSFRDASPGDAQSVFNHVVTSGGVNRFRSKANAPLEFTRVQTSGILGPIKAHNIGRFGSPEDTFSVDVSNIDFIQFSDGDDGIDTVSNFVDTEGGVTGIAGRKLFVLFNDSTMVESLNASTGRIFFPGDSRNRRTPAGLRTLFYSYNDGVLGGITWREVFSQWPMETVSWDPENLAQDATDSVDVAYYGAEVGDPVVVGFAGIKSSTGGNFDLKAHVVAADVIRVFVTNKNSAAKNLASANLRVKIVR